MKILFLTHSFNSLTQRLFIELQNLGHEISIEFDINDKVSLEAVKLFQPNLIIAPFLKRKIQKEVWQNYLTWIIHPGILGDRGPSALDWAILNDEKIWGVSVIEAVEELDAGPVWGYEYFAMPSSRSKSSIYRNEITEATMQAIKKSLKRLENNQKPVAVSEIRENIKGNLHQKISQNNRKIDWQNDNSQTIIRKINSADSSPGILTNFFDNEYFLYDAHIEKKLKGKPKEILAKHENAVCIATTDGAIWIGHLKKRRDNEKKYFKLPATTILKDFLKNIPEKSTSLLKDKNTYQEIFYEIKGKIAFLHFPFYNGAMSSEQCSRLKNAFQKVCETDAKIIVLMGGNDFFSNGIHLNTIENAEDSPQESMQNILAMNTLVKKIIQTTNKITVAAMRGNIGAGGVFFALACDFVWAKNSVVLNPHYKNMGNLYGSEFWTYLLPKRVGKNLAEIKKLRLPIGVEKAKSLKLIDDHFGNSRTEFEEILQNNLVETLTQENEIISNKINTRKNDEIRKPLAEYEQEELAKMKQNFFGFDPSYHVARYNFVNKVKHSRTPLFLAKHRNKNNSN